MLKHRYPHWYIKLLIHQIIAFVLRQNKSIRFCDIYFTKFEYKSEVSVLNQADKS